MECSQVYDLFTTKDLDIQRNNSQLISNFGVLLPSIWVKGCLVACSVEIRKNQS
jgi:hypothetical protein